MDQVTCRLDIPAVPGLEGSEITVGRHLLFSCEGSWDRSFDFANAQIKLEESNKYVIKVLKAEARNANSFDVDLTVYAAGDIKFPEMILIDGTREISLGQQQLSIKSVLQPQQQGQEQQKPFGFLFPLRLEWPALYFILAASAVVLFLVGLIYQLRRAARFARLIADLKQYESSVSADLQFYKSLRTAEKQNYPLDELEKSFRLYVLRVLEVPMFVLNQRQIIKFLRKRKPFLKTERQQVNVLLSEFEEIKTNKKELSSSEKLELVHKLYRFVDRTQNIKTKVAP